MTPKAAAERLEYLFSEKWHTEETLTTDSDGNVTLYGYYGDYLCEADGNTFTVGLHK